jgi:hypothetical protein
MHNRGFTPVQFRHGSLYGIPFGDLGPKSCSR